MVTTFPYTPFIFQTSEPKIGTEMVQDLHTRSRTVNRRVSESKKRQPSLTMNGWLHPSYLLRCVRYVFHVSSVGYFRVKERGDRLPTPRLSVEDVRGVRRGDGPYVPNPW